ncbi:hypothetical protein ACF0H5_009737 [Mactra antiquata]
MIFNSLFFGIIVVCVNGQDVNKLNQRLKDLAEKVAFDLMEFSKSLENVQAIIENGTTSNSTDNNTVEVSNMTVVSNNKIDTIDQTLLHELIGRLESVERAFISEKQYVRETFEANCDIESMIKGYIDREINGVRNTVHDLTTKVESNTDQINEDKATITAIGEDVQRLTQIHGDNQQKIGELIMAVNVVSFELKLNKTWQCYLESCYFAGVDATWDESKQACEQYGAFLAEVDTEEENGFLVNFAASQPARGDNGFHLGLSDQEQEGMWLWASSGRKITETFNNFKSPEPNGKRRENCLHLYRQANWHWNDVRCDNKMGYICEVKNENISLI